MTENKWRENLKETTRLITSQAFSLKITNLILELQYGLMVINFDRAHVHTHTHTHTRTRTHAHTHTQHDQLPFHFDRLKWPWGLEGTVSSILATIFKMKTLEKWKLFVYCSSETKDGIMLTTPSTHLRY